MLHLSTPFRLSFFSLILGGLLYGILSCSATTNEQSKESASYPCSFENLKNNNSFYIPSSTPLKDLIVKALEKQKDSLHLIVFLGTWCGDSKRIMPVFFNYLQETKFNTTKHLSLFCVQRGMTMEDTYLPEGLSQTFQIKKVPTIIFFKNGKEITRIIEYGQDKFPIGEQRDIPMWEQAFQQALAL